MFAHSFTLTKPPASWELPDGETHMARIEGDLQATASEQLRP